MAYVIADRVRETTSTTGLVAYATAGAALGGYRTFLAGVGSGNDCSYCCTNGIDWEVGTGTVTVGQLTRTAIHSSSNANAAVNWAAGAKDIFLTVPAFVMAGTLGMG